MNKNQTENINKIKELSKFYNKLLNHLETLTSLIQTTDSCYKNYDKIKEMFEDHKKTREWAKVLLCNDFSKLSNNIFYKLISNQIVPQSIVFINLITMYHEDILKYIELKDNENLKNTIKSTKDYNDICQKEFKSFKNKLDTIS